MLFAGVDLVADNLCDASRRAPPNAIFGRLALQDAPGELAGFADRLTVLFPWGSLLRAVAFAEPAGLSALRAICRRGADVRFVFELGGDPRALERAYRDLALALAGTPLPVESARALPTTWAKKLGFSGKPRSFWDFRGEAR